MFIQSNQIRNVIENAQKHEDYWRAKYMQANQSSMNLSFFCIFLVRSSFFADASRFYYCCCCCCCWFNRILIVCKIAAFECDFSQLLRHSFPPPPFSLSMQKKYPQNIRNTGQYSKMKEKKPLACTDTQTNLYMHVVHKPASTKISIILKIFDIKLLEKYFVRMNHLINRDDVYVIFLLLLLFLLMVCACVCICAFVGDKTRK